jgi:hypothetical protein
MGELLKQLRVEMQEKRMREREEAAAETRHDLLLTAVLCVLWSAAGIFLLLWSFHTMNAAYGRMAFYAGLAIGNGGWVFTILAAYRRGERRGDW